MLYAIGDIHGNVDFMIQKLETIPREALLPVYVILLGDAGLNFYLDKRDDRQKEALQSYLNQRKDTMKLLFVRGNHEARPQNICSYDQKKMFGGRVLVEDKYPDLIFLKDGELYQIEGENFMVLGGGYSVDYFKRLMHRWSFFVDEELSELEFGKIIESKGMEGRKVHVLSHMVCEAYSPAYYESGRIPRTEYYLQKFFEQYKAQIIDWWCGHYHRQYQKRLPEGIVINFCYKNLEEIIKKEAL